jgi:hypothetical protein
MTPDYTHPRIDDFGTGRDDRAGMAAEAASALERRRDSYPTLVEAGKMPAALADADIAAWQAIADDWHWIATGRTLGGNNAQPDARALYYNLPARIIALETAIGRFFGIMDRNGGAERLTTPQRQQITALIAMRWWAELELRGGGKLHARDLARCGHELRAKQRSKAA